MLIVIAKFQWAKFRCRLIPYRKTWNIHLLTGKTSFHYWAEQDAEDENVVKNNRYQG